MIFKQLFDQKSSTYTYLIASSKGREALIIDPVLENVSDYIILLKELDLRLVKVIDTHIHADHVTGASKLKDITKCSTIMGDHTPADAVEIKVKDDEYINLENLKIKARIKGYAGHAHDPGWFTTAPIPATNKLLESLNWSADEVDLWEVNEAFAPVPLAWAHDLEADKSKLNVNGGAMALGHPLGATGAKLMTTMLHELERRNGNYALQAICEGGGTANATIIKRLS